MRIAILFLFVAACRTPAPAPTPAETPATAPRPAPEPATEAATPDPAATPEPEPTCSLSPGTTRGSIDVEGTTREYELYVGAEVPERPSLLFVWHGWGGNAKDMLRLIQPDSYWKDAVVIAPEGLPRSFREGGKVKAGWQNKGGELDERDFKLFDALLASLRRSHCVDPTRVYSTGFSNGGFFTNALACHRRDALAAAAPRSGGGPYPEEVCQGPLPILIHHGRKDVVLKFELAERSLQRWTRWAGCTPPAELPPTGCVDVAGCSEPVRFCITPGGHSFPKKIIPRDVATFLRKHARAPAAAP